MGLPPVRHRPAHSAHGQVHWLLMMGPLGLWRSLRPRRRRDGAEAPARSRGFEVTPPPPLSLVPTPPQPPGSPPPPPPYDRPRFVQPWGSNEGTVRPKWESPTD
jgi:hypothetical protein